MVIDPQSAQHDSETLSAPVKFDDLLAAYEWVSSSSPAENEAFVSRATGNIHWSSNMVDLDSELPEDIEDGSIYVSVPHKYHLDLGKNLALTFAEERLADSYEAVSNIFRQRGAYGKFKDLLERKGHLDAWYKYEANAIELALREWAAEQRLLLSGQLIKGKNTRDMDEGKSSPEDDMPVIVTNRRLMCENSKFFIYFDHVTDQAGFETRDYLVVTPRNTGKDFVTGVAVLPVVDGHVGLVRIFRPALRAYFWEIPHGFAEEGEANKVSATRELLEETGLDADPAHIASLGLITPDSGVMAARVELFVAENGQMRKRKEGELGVREFRLFHFGVFERMITGSEVQDTFTLAAWCRYRLLQHGPEGRAA